MKLVEMILDEMDNISKAQKKFFALLMQTIVSAYGHINFRNLSRQSFISEKSFRRWFKTPFDFCQFNEKAIERVLPSASEVIAAFDQSFESKAGKLTWGKGVLLEWLCISCRKRVGIGSLCLD